MNRRQFIHTLAGATATTALALEGCSSAPTPSDAGAAALGEIPTDQMEYRTNLHGDKVSILGYGCMRWPTVPGMGEKDNDIDQEQVNALVDYAMAHGVNYYDTSPVYCKGYSEQATGIALARHPRSSYYIATKLSNFSQELWSFEKSVEMYHRSMEYLQTDYIDYYLLHSVGGGGMDRFRARFLDNGVLDYLLKEREAGRIRNLGFSIHGDIAVFDYLLAHNDIYHWDFVQIQMNYVDWDYASSMNARNTNASYLYEELRKRNIPAVIMEPLLGGGLASLNQHATATLKALDPQRSIASWAFRYLGNFPGVLTALSGMTYMEHLQDNLRSYAPFKPLTDAEMQTLQTIAHQFATFPLVRCTACQYCMPCPYGIDIPSIFRHYNQCLNDGMVEDNTQSPEYRRLRHQYLVSYDRRIPRERQADHCIGCNQCVSHCPQHINIPAKLTQIDQYILSLKRNK